MIENNNENKAKFNAQYWGQRIGSIYLSENDQKHDLEIGHVHGVNFHWINVIHLSQITDEHAIEVAKIEYSFDETWSQEKLIYHGRAFVLTFSTIESRFPVEVADFLRSNSYALPWNGLLVEELQKRVWIKLREL